MQSHRVWRESQRGLTIYAGHALFFGDIGGAAGGEGQRSQFLPLFLGTLQVPGEQGMDGYRGGSWRWWGSCTQLGNEETVLVLPALGKTTCWSQEHLKQLSPAAYSNICTCSDQGKPHQPASHLLSWCFELTTSLYHEPVLNGKQTGTDIASNTVHFKINASQQQERHVVDLVKAERNPTQKEIDLVSLVRNLSKSWVGKRGVLPTPASDWAAAVAAANFCLSLSGAVTAVC